MLCLIEGFNHIFDSLNTIKFYPFVFYRVYQFLYSSIEDLYVLLNLFVTLQIFEVFFWIITQITFINLFSFFLLLVEYFIDLESLLCDEMESVHFVNV